MNTELLAFAKEAWPGHCSQLLASARRFADNIFLFDDPWDMEQSSIPVEFKGPINWEYHPSEDPEWTYMLGRQSYVLLLARACAVSGDAAFAQKAGELMADFIDHAPLTEASKPTTWRSLDAGIRVSNWLEAWDILTGCGCAPVWMQDKLEASLRVHIDYLMDVDTPFCRLSNWGAIQNVGMYQAALFLGDSAVADIAERRLADEMSIQVDPDGWHWEQSPMYHAEVQAAVLRMVRLAKRAGRELPAIIPDTALAMCRAMARSAKPDHCQFLQSDSDQTDLRGLITVGAILLGCPHLKAHGFAQPDFESLFWMTAEEKAAFDALEARPFAPVAAHTHSGNYYLRTGWAENDSCIHFHCGNMGGGHGHADLLHVDLCALGRDVLVDSGRFTYVDNADRLWYKSCEAHNTFTMDGVPFTECTHTWEFGQVALPLPGGHFERDGMNFAEGGHLGYMRLDDPAVCRRMVIQLDRRVAVVMDLIHTRGEHRYDTRWHFAGKDGLTLEGDRAVYQADGLSTEVFFPGREARTLTTRYSLHYTSEQEKSTLVLENTHTGLCAMPTVFVSAEGEAAKASVTLLPVRHVKSGRLLPEDSASALQIDAFGERWTLLFNWKDSVGENDLLGAGEISGHGRVLAAHNGKQTLLAW